MQLKVLIIDEDSASADAVAQMLRGEEVELSKALKVQEGISRVRKEGIDIVILSAHVSDPDAFTALETLKTIRPEPEVILVATSAKMEDAVKAIKLGASDYVSRHSGLLQLKMALDRARRVRTLTRENLQLRQELRDRGSERQIAGRTPEMDRLHDLIDRAARSDASVLIVGEEGTGKELVAHAIHSESSRSSEPFVGLRLDGMRREDAEREFNSALARVGNGTLFFHEVAALPLDLQEVVALHAPPKARVLASSSRNLMELVGRGLFRQDLFDAFAKTIITVSPLRERRDDIPLIAQAILQQRAARNQKTARSVSPEALTTLLRHTWPGNVRELEQAIERACELGDGNLVERRHLPPSVIQAAEAGRASDTQTVATRSLKEMESEVIRRMLVEQGGNTDTVSRLLKIDRSTLYRKIKRYGIDLDNMKDDGTPGPS